MEELNVVTLEMRTAVTNFGSAVRESFLPAFQAFSDSLNRWYWETVVPAMREVLHGRLRGWHVPDWLARPIVEHIPARWLIWLVLR